MKTFRVLIYEDDVAWLTGFEFNVKARLMAKDIDFRKLHREDDSTLMQDLEFLPDLIMVDHDLGTLIGPDIIAQIDGDPQYSNVSIFYYSGGETIETLQAYAATFKCAVHCYIKDEEDLENAVIEKELN